ncbi:MAG TPA: glycerophosphodiester phosphodiesterase family protein [Acidobacteriaceae bacterium]|jgi:glycerophosphoryl diester phosphodiesterase
MFKAAALLILMSLPLPMRTELDAPHTILVHAHRGGRAYRPENSIPSFRYAISVGADVLELDLAVTKDNVLVVSHSPFLTQPAPETFSNSKDPKMAAVITAALANERHCDGPPLPPGTYIHSLTLAQLKQYDCGSHALPAFPNQVAEPHTTIPTFEEVLDLAPQGEFQFNVETKIFPNRAEITPTPEAFVSMIDEAVKRHHLQSRVILQSFDFRTLQAMRVLDPSIRLSALFGQAQYDRMMGITDADKTFAHVAQAAQLRPGDFFSPDASLATPAEVKWAHEHGFQVAPYTVNAADGWQKLADAHVDAIITDDPAGLLKWLRAQDPALHP